MPRLVDPHVDAGLAQRPSVLARRYGPELLTGHFALGRSVLPRVPAGWSRAELQGWHLAHDAALPAHKLVDADGVTVGWLLGHALDLAAGGLRERFDVPAPFSAARFGAVFEEWLYGHGGRFAAVLLRGRPGLHLDAYASLPVLYDPERALVASSPFLFADDDGTLVDSDLVDVFGVARGPSPHSFMLGTSSVAGVERLQPNHTLDLDTWIAARSWPREAPPTTRSPEPVEEIGETLEQTMTALATLRPNVSLTAGADTRLLLASARRLVDDFSYFTIALPDATGAADSRTAPRLARRFGLDHRVIPWVEPTAEHVERFLYRTGCMVGERRGRLASATYARLGGTRAYVSGISNFTMYPGEFRWGRADRPDMRLEVHDLIRRFWLPPHPEILRRVEAWLADVPRMDAIRTLALFSEERVLCWAGGLTFAYPEACTFTVYPSSHRRIAEAALRLDWRERLPHVRQRLIHARWPELLEVGINEQTIGERLGRKTRRTYRLAQAAARKAALLVCR